MSAILKTIAVVCVALAVVPVAAQTQQSRKVVETLLAPFPPEVYDSTIVSPGAAHVAFIQKTADGEQAVLDGKAEKAYAKVAELAFSPDGRRLAYAAQSGDRWVIVESGKEQGPYDRVGSPVFSPDSARLAFVALVPDGKRSVVVDGKPGKPYDLILEGRIVFSPDGSRVAYAAQKPEGWFVVVDDQEFGPYGFVGSSSGIHFSRDGRRTAWAAMSGESKKWFAVLDGKPRAEYENLGEMALSADGSRLAYAALAGGKWQVVADGKPQPPFDAIAEGSLRFSPDGKRLAYAGQSGEQWCAVLDGKPGKLYTDVGQLTFRPDSQELAYVARQEWTETVMLADKALRTVDRVAKGSLVFSPGGRLAYIARTPRGCYVVADDNRKPSYYTVGYLTIAPDGRRAVYAAIPAVRNEKTRELEAGKTTVTVVDDKESAARWDAIWMAPGEDFTFLSLTRFRYIAVKDGKIYRVEESLD